ncbi:MAG: hypothetical protein ACK4SY_00255 [Pyrobaculum sp.]
MYLVIIKSQKEIYKRLGRRIEALELLPGVYLTWSPREKIEKAVETTKRELTREWEEKGEGPFFDTAIIELTEGQTKSLKTLSRAVIESLAEAMLVEMERLHTRLRSRDKKAVGWYRDLARRYKKLIDTSFVLDIYPSILDKLKEKWMEISLEAGRLR